MHIYTKLIVFNNTKKCITRKLPSPLLELKSSVHLHENFPFTAASIKKQIWTFGNYLFSAAIKSMPSFVITLQFLID